MVSPITPYTEPPAEPSPMNEVVACKGHGIVSGDEVVVPPPSVPTQCAYVHGDGEPDFQCSFHTDLFSSSRYCVWHRGVVRLETIRAKAEAYDRLVDSDIVVPDVVGELLKLQLRNVPDKE